MRFVTSSASEFLVLGRGGRLRNLGPAARVFLWPGDTCIRVSGAKREACFAMTQESKDGIPLRFKGILVYRVVDPVAAASAFEFTTGTGHAEIGALLEHVVLGELRDVVSQLGLRACIEGRRTTLSHAVGDALARVVQGEDGRAWGIALDVVQVSQVYIVDDALRARLETELRNEVVARAERSDLELQESMELVRRERERRTTAAEFEQEREMQRLERERRQIEIENVRSAHEVARERVALDAALEAEDAEAKARTKTLALQAERGTLELELEVRRRRNEIRALEVEAELLGERGRAELERELLPQRQVPEVAQALASMFQGADLAVYGAENVLTTTLGPLVALLGRQLRGASFEEGPAS